MFFERAISPPMTNSRIIPKPRWLEELEARLAARVPFHPNALSALKLVLALPIILSLGPLGLIPSQAPPLVFALFALFAFLDYLDGVVAREQRKDTTFGRVFDRLTDWPLLIALAASCCGPLPVLPMALKLGLDLVLLTLFCLGRGPVENRIRTTMSYAVLLVLLAVSQGWAPALITPQVAEALLWTNITFNAFIVLVRLEVLQKRLIADALSLGNLLSGVASMVAAALGFLPLCLVFLAVGALLDGLDGAAARRWGGTSWGVWSDDVADAVSYGLAPGVAIGCVLGGLTGWLVGAAYALFTLGRLAYFTLIKDQSDPRHFSGMPSTVGGLLVLGALVVFQGSPTLIGVAVGAACALMVGFGNRYRHLGRLLGERPRLLLAIPVTLAALILTGLLLGPRVPAALALIGALGYGLYPTVTALARAALRRLQATPTSSTER